MDSTCGLFFWGMMPYLTVSKPSDNSICSVSKSVDIFLVVLLRLTLHGIFTSFPARTMVVLGIAVTRMSSFSDDVLMRFTSVETLLRLVFS